MVKKKRSAEACPFIFAGCARCSTRSRHQRMNARRCSTKARAFAELRRWGRHEGVDRQRRAAPSGERLDERAALEIVVDQQFGREADP